MLTVPSVLPKNSHDLWYSSSYHPHVLRRSSKPKSKYLPGAQEHEEEEAGASDIRSVFNARLHHGNITVGPLEAAEAAHVRYIESIRTFGFTFLRPPGFSKTEQALMEEQALSESESEDNGLIENPNGELVMLEGEVEQEAAEMDGDLEEGEVEDDDDDDEDNLPGELEEDEEAEEALDGWPRRYRQRRSRASSYREDEVDLDADIPEGDELGMGFDDEEDEDDVDEDEEAEDELEEEGYYIEEDEDEDDGEVEVEGANGVLTRQRTSRMLQYDADLSYSSPQQPGRSLTRTRHMESRNPVVEFPIPSDDDYEMDLDDED
ncbi:hypothetical protein V1511DRAFT_499013 [Dipodascopsis uninucleata]